MERHSIDEQRAFEMLRDEARRSNRKIIEIAEGSHRQREPASQVACRVGVGRATDVDVVVNTLTEVFDPTYEDAVVLALFILAFCSGSRPSFRHGRGHHRLGCFRAHQRSSWRST